MEFKVKVDLGDLYINDEYVAKCSYDADSIAGAIAVWLEESEDEL